MMQCTSSRAIIGLLQIQKIELSRRDIIKALINVLSLITIYHWLFVRLKHGTIEKFRYLIATRV